MPPSFSKPGVDRLPNVRDELTRALALVNRELAAAAVEGFYGVEERACAAVRASERLARVLDRLVLQGFVPRGRAEGDSPFATAEVRSVIDGVQKAVGRLARTAPDRFSADYGEYVERARALVDLASAVLKRGVQAVDNAGFDAWRSFDKPPDGGRA